MHVYVEFHIKGREVVLHSIYHKGGKGHKGLRPEMSLDSSTATLETKHTGKKTLQFLMENDFSN